MNSLKKITLLTSLLLLLSACERSDYTTWQCESTDHTQKEQLTLDRSKMLVGKDTYNYCGSLGKLSYFDKQCLGVVGSESVKFTPESGQLIIRDKNFQCKVL